MKEFSQLRSFLFVTLSDDRLLRARSYLRAAAEVDALILDLEDSVTTQGKSEARARLDKTVETFGAINSNLFIRINNTEADWLDDTDKVAAIRHPSLRAVIVPKTETPLHLIRVHERIQNPSIQVVPFLETPKGILTCSEILKEGPSRTCVFFGCEDLASELGVLNPTEHNMLYAAQNLVLHAALTQTPVIGTVSAFSAFGVDVREEYRRAVQLSRDVGFSGSFGIHPAQIPIINEIYGFVREREHLQKIVNAAKVEKAVFTFEGKMYGPPMIRRYQKILNRG